ncbi:MAG: hypothetical protein KDG50_01860 [Chromatiales bacterium]|nr:hypothetical protein [Chromatiales bacterium]
MKKILVPAAAALVIAVGGCVSSGNTLYEQQNKYDSALAAAKAAQKKAASVDGEWRDTGKHIKDAMAAAEKLDYDSALKMLKKAQMEGERGYEQATSERAKTNMHPSYL